MKISSAAYEDSEVALVVVYDLLQVPVPHILPRHIPAWVEEEGKAADTAAMGI